MSYFVSHCSKILVVALVSRVVSVSDCGPHAVMSAEWKESALNEFLHVG